MHRFSSLRTISVAIVLAATTCVPAVARPKPAASPSAAPAPTPTPGPIQRAQSAYASLVAGTVDRSQLDPSLSSDLTADRLASYAKSLGPLGTPSNFSLAGTNRVDGVTTYNFIVTYGSGALAFVYGIDDATQRVVKLYVRTSR